MLYNNQCLFGGGQNNFLTEYFFNDMSALVSYFVLSTRKREKGRKGEKN